MRRHHSIFTAALILVATTGAIITHGSDCGKALEPTATLDAPGAMDAVISGNHLFYIGHGNLYAADISDPLQPKEVAKVDFEGRGRQIEIEGNPGNVAVRNGALIICDGYNGLAIYDDFVNTLKLDVDEKAFLPKD